MFRLLKGATKITEIGVWVGDNKRISGYWEKLKCDYPVSTTSNSSGDIVQTLYKQLEKLN